MCLDGNMRSDKSARPCRRAMVLRWRVAGSAAAGARRYGERKLPSLEGGRLVALPIHGLSTLGFLALATGVQRENSMTNLPVVGKGRTVLFVSPNDEDHRALTHILRPAGWSLTAHLAG